MWDCSAHAYFSAVRCTYFKVAFVTAHEKLWIFPFLCTICRLYKAVTKRYCFAEAFKKFPRRGKKPSYCCEIRRFSQRKVDLVLVAALPTRRERKMPNDSTAQKRKNQKNSGSTTGSAGANKDGPTHKICDENPSPRPSKSSEEGMPGKSASHEGSELLKFGSMLVASITELKDTMAGKFDQLEEILTQPNIWVQDTEERDDASEDDGDIDHSGSTTDEPPSKKSKLTPSSEVASKQRVLNSIAEKCRCRRKLTQVLMNNWPKWLISWCSKRKTWWGETEGKAKSHNSTC